MKVFITGGSGLVGRYVSRMLAAEGHRVTILSRSPRVSPDLHPGISYLGGDPTEPGPWQERLAGHDAVINLAGAPIFRRWTARYKRTILDSRVETTRNVVSATAASPDRSLHLLNASAVGYYGFHGDETLDEENGSGDDFLARVARDWEATAGKAADAGARVVLCRFGIVLGRGGGALATMVENFRRRPVAALGSGRQWVSWVHLEDLSRILLFLLERGELRGAVNCVSPNPVRNRELTELVARQLGRSVSRFPVPGFALRLVMGEFANALLEGQRVLPRKLLEGGFAFEFPDLDNALKDLMRESA
ncbi:epimerase [candidate division TA06 bacterium DG_24]|uniref:Epimerase n=3 Tax=Bacteria division TA06 TaxID=1156500 RepID=A0A0S8JKG9_UNCT6|nr:MAG: epimerase [candidate division TA06 bacterium DG_24]KPK69841.1 MAG: epimerase [candidate division TA06 bacterium SM23_40]KPL10247.1 MAG: epimerase [candidate division TA06 bacterium SM1_40]